MYSGNPVVSVSGLGYVGLPLAVAFAESGLMVVGYDNDKIKTEKYKKGIDVTNEVGNERLKNEKIIFTSVKKFLAMANYHIVAVPTPIDIYGNPNMEYVISATKNIANILTKGDYVIYESTVCPGATRECIKILEDDTGMKCGEDFKVGFSPERVAPATTRKLEDIVKVVSGVDEESTNKIAELYERIIKAGVYKAESIEVAEACKIMENIQRDVNIALMNELSKVFGKMNIDTNSVIKAASTKWNFNEYYPGLVGGHCLKPDSMIMMSDGVEKKIKNIKVGEYVISHTGKPRRVLRTIKHEYNGELCSIYAKGIYFPLETTCDHKVLISDWSRTGINRKWEMKNTRMLESSKLVKYEKNKLSHRLHQHGSTISDDCSVNPKFARLLGLYLAEGSTDGRKGEEHKRTRLAFHEDEVNLHNDVKEICKNLYGVNTHIRKPHDGKCLVVEIGNKKITQELIRFGGKLSWEKKLNNEIFSWSKECLEELWNGWFDGDGTHKGKEKVVVTVSRQLSRDMYRIGLMIGKSLSIRIQSSKDKRDAYYITDLKRNYRNNNHRTVNIDRIEKSQYSGFVYDLEVDEDHSFIADTFVVSNCIGIDPYYLIDYTKANNIKIPIIESARETNERLTDRLFMEVVRTCGVKDKRIAILGLTFKENCNDLRNSKVKDLYDAFNYASAEVFISDPIADEEQIINEYGTNLTKIEDLQNIDCVIVCVKHNEYKCLTRDFFDNITCDNKVLFDIKGVYNREDYVDYDTYFRL